MAGDYYVSVKSLYEDIYRFIAMLDDGLTVRLDIPSSNPGYLFIDIYRDGKQIETVQYHGNVGFSIWYGDWRSETAYGLKPDEIMGYEPEGTAHRVNQKLRGLV